jgi:SLT domain-containing protein
MGRKQSKATELLQEQNVPKVGNDWKANQNRTPTSAVTTTLSKFEQPTKLL